MSFFTRRSFHFSLAWFLLILSDEPKDAVLLKSEVFLIGWMPNYFSVFRNRAVL